MNPLTDGIRIDTGLDLFAKGMKSAELESIYYDLVSDREQERLLMESATLDEIDEAYNPGEIEMVLEAITVKKFAQTESKMRALVRVLNTQALKGIAALDAQIGKPRKSGLFATVTVQVPMTDGQVLSIVFHSPTGDEKKILPDDMIVAFRWLLNKRDITHAVSPERGGDVSLQTVAKRVMQLVAKNSEAFQKAQTEINAQKEELAAVEQSVRDVDAANQATVAKIADLKVEIEQVEDTIETTRRRLEKVRQENDDLEARLEEMRGKKQEQAASAKLAELREQARKLGFDAEADQLYLAKDEAGLQALIDSKKAELESVIEPADFNPTDPANYTKILDDPELQLKYQDVLDSFFQERLSDVRNALRGKGWIGDGKQDSPNMILRTTSNLNPNSNSTSQEKLAIFSFRYVGAGRNVVGMSVDIKNRVLSYQGKKPVLASIADDLTQTPEQLAHAIDSAATTQAAPITEKTEVGILPPAEQIDGNPAKRAAKILHSLGKAEAAMKDGFHVKLKSGAYQDLSIETHDDGGGNRRVYFTQYIEENGDLVIDSEMGFLTNIYTGLLKLAEIGYRGPMGEVRRTNIGRAEKSWANTFSKNLIDQGFEKGEEKGDEPEPEPAPFDAPTPGVAYYRIKKDGDGWLIRTINGDVVSGYDSKEEAEKMAEAMETSRRYVGAFLKAERLYSDGESKKQHIEVSKYSGKDYREAYLRARFGIDGFAAHEITNDETRLGVPPDESMDVTIKEFEGEPWADNALARMEKKSEPDLPPESDPNAGLNGYIAFYKGNKTEVWAKTSLEARDKAAAFFKAKKPYEVTVKLAEPEPDIAANLSPGDTVYFELASGWKTGNWRGPVPDDPSKSVVVYDGGNQVAIDNADLRLEMPEEMRHEPGPEPAPPNPEPETRPEAVKILDQIVSGEFDDSPAQIDSLLDQAAEDLEAAGLIEQYDDLLNQAADHYTEVLRKEAA